MATMSECSSPDSAGTITVLATHYRLPIKRLIDFCAWNDAAFARHGISVTVVTDVYRPIEHEFDFPLRLFTFPVPLEIFSITKCSNFGIRKIGTGVICKTDIDCLFSDAALDEIAVVQSGHSVFYNYRMAESSTPIDLGRAKQWAAGSGTVAMHWDDWDAMGGYDQRLEGYCSDDADCVARAPQPCKGLGDLWHIAPEGGRFWNRETINPLNRRHCAEIRAAGRYQRTENWGVF